MSALSPEAATALRASLLDQLAYLIDEVEAQKTFLGRLQPALLEARPYEGERSIKEMYGLLVAAGEQIHLPRLHRLFEAATPSFDALDNAALVAAEDWNAVPLAALLARMQAARTALLGRLRPLPAEAWTRTAEVGGVLHDVYALAHAITQHDAEVLRAVGYRLHESHLTLRPPSDAEKG